MNPVHQISQLDRGRGALARGAWEEALEALRGAVEDDPRDAAAWEQLGNARMWLQQTDPAIEARETAYALYRERGDDEASARLCLDLANDSFEARGEMAVANGWFMRARRLLEALPTCREHALMRIWDAYMALMDDEDPIEAERHAAAAVAIAETVRAKDVLVLALALRGLSQVSAGEVRDGLSLLDEAVAGAIAGELTDPQWFYLTCCCMIDACDQVRDFGRSLQWCRRLQEFATRWRVEAFLTTCRIKYTGALLWRGEWEAYEDQLQHAIEELRATRPHSVGSGLVRLAELRRRQGRRAESQELLESATGQPLALLIRAAIALDDGDARGALEIVDLKLRSTAAAARTERIPALEVKIRAHVALGELREARRAAAELEEIAATIGTAPVRACAMAGRGMVAMAEGELERARQLLDEAAYLLDANGSRYEGARVRLEVARCLAAAGRRPSALEHARTALAALEALGADLDASRARSLLSTLEPVPASTSRGGRAGRQPGLTRRQREVLSLVAQGLGDREIAERLFLSEHTIHRHMANILLRLGVSSRAAAVARALRDGIV